ncbi:MAG: C69 family dipeptidase [Anaerolineaceae bacterium]|nr:C69 family dipeptidase [Anaerolineaceae bacterium]
MCDTFVALKSATKDGSVLFGKNSDRDPNEAHEVILVPAMKYESGSTVQCTYLEIPQVQDTNAVLLCKPFWIWGAEMGANEHGVVIGNEALFSKEPAGKEPGLIGMDYLRLALERTDTAEAAAALIIELLEEYGQSGNCGYDHPMYYHNSYLIADPNGAWVLETVGKEWALEKVRDVRSISNQITIEGKWHRKSAGLVSYAQEKGWHQAEENFSFRQAYSDKLYTFFSDSTRRRECTTEQLMAHRGEITEETMFSILRTHRDRLPSRSSLYGSDVCMHAGFGPIRLNQSTGSMVARLTPQGCTFWVTGTSTPCTSLFKPVWFDGGVPKTSSPLSGEYRDEHLWWKHERLQRLIAIDYAERIAKIQPDRDVLEKRFLTEARKLETQKGERSESMRRLFTAACFEEEMTITDHWIEQVQSMGLKQPLLFYHRLFWNRLNQRAKMPKASSGKDQ